MDKQLLNTIHKFAEDREIDWMAAKVIGEQYGKVFKTEDDLREWKYKIDNYLKTFDASAFEKIEEACKKKKKSKKKVNEALDRKNIESIDKLKKEIKKVDDEIEKNEKKKRFAFSGGHNPYTAGPSERVMHDEAEEAIDELLKKKKILKKKLQIAQREIAKNESRNLRENFNINKKEPVEKIRKNLAKSALDSGIVSDMREGLKYVGDISDGKGGADPKKLERVVGKIENKKRLSLGKNKKPVYQSTNHPKAKFQKMQKTPKIYEGYSERGKQDGTGPYKGSAQKGRGPMTGKKAGLYTKAQLARLKKWYNVDTNEEALERAISDVKKGREPLKDSYKRKGDTGEEGVKKLDKKTMDGFRKANESKNSLEDVLDKDISKKKLNERLINMSYKRFTKNVEFEFSRALRADNGSYSNNLDNFSRELGKIYTKHKNNIKYFISHIRDAFYHFEKLKDLEKRNPNKPLKDIVDPWKEVDLDEEMKRHGDGYERNMKSAYTFFKRLPGKIQNRFFIIHTRTEQRKFF